MNRFKLVGLASVAAVAVVTSTSAAKAFQVTYVYSAALGDSWSGVFDIDNFNAPISSSPINTNPSPSDPNYNSITAAGSSTTITSPISVTAPRGNAVTWRSFNSGNLALLFFSQSLNSFVTGSTVPTFAQLIAQGPFDVSLADWFGGSSAPELTGTGGTVSFGAVTPVPGPLPLLGAAAAFGYSRKLRKLIKTSKKPSVTH